MKQRLKAVIITILAVTVGASMAFAAPARLSSITDHVQKPTLVTLDSQGNLYVSETSKNVLLIFNRKGQFQKSLSIASPLGAAVDAAGMIYVCSDNNSRIDVYNPDLTFARTFITDIKTNSITIDKDGKFYIVDSARDMIKIYDASGALLSSFGSTGSGDGQFNIPTGLAINEASGEVYVTDRQIITTTNGPVNGARIQVFDKNGTFRRSFNSYGPNAGQISSPVGIAVDKAGSIYVDDNYQRVVHIIDPNTWTWSGGLYDMTVPLQLPLGVAVGKDGIAYVTSHAGRSVEKYGLDGYTTMDTSPAALTFVARQLIPNPTAQTIVLANSGSGILNWTAAKDSDWITLGDQPSTVASVTGSTGPASSNGLALGVDITNLKAGAYQGAVTIVAESGATDVIPVNLTVRPPAMISVGTGVHMFSAKKGTAVLPQPDKVIIDNIESLPWSTKSDATWLGIAPASGSATTDVNVAVDTTGLAPGTYAGNITFLAPGALGDNNKLITVSLSITASRKLSVTTNRPEAKFTITGPATYTGTGTSWSKEEAPAGDYTITYDAIAGYKKPATQTKTLTADGDLAFAGNYASWKDLAARKNIVAAKGPSANNNAQVRMYKADGTAVTSTKPDFMALDSAYGANVAVGDIDGDGTAEIIVGTGAGADNTTLVKIYRADKSYVTEFTAFTGKLGGVNVAVADFDGDGKAEIIVAPAGGAECPGTVKVFAFVPGSKTVVPTGIAITAVDTLSGVNVAAADTEGNLAPRLITAPVAGLDANPGSVRIWKVDTSQGLGSWTATPIKEIALSNKYGATVASGDTDGDGKDEIIIGVSGSSSNDESEKSLVKIFKADGTEVKRIPVFDEKYGVNVAAADLDGDGIAEIIAGIGAAPGVQEAPVATGRQGRTSRQRNSREGEHDHETESLIRVYSAAGTLNYAIPYEGSASGVKVAVGDLGL